MVSVRSLCSAFVQWPQVVQRHFLHSLLSLGFFAHCMWDDEHEEASPVALVPPSGLRTSKAAQLEPLQPLGLALPMGPPPRTPREATTRTRRLQLCEAATAAVRRGSGDTRLAALTQVLCETMQCDHVLYLKVEPGEAGQPPRLRAAAISGHSRRASQGQDDPADGGCCGPTVMERGEPLCLQRATADPRFRAAAAAAALPEGTRVRNLLSVPVPGASGAALPRGVVELVNAAGSWGFEPAHQADLQAVCAAIAPLLGAD